MAKVLQFVYNAAQLVLWVQIAHDLFNAIRLSTATNGVFLDWDFGAIYEEYSPKLVVAQGLSVIEILLPLLGITKSSIGAAFVQVAGRSLIVAIVHVLVPELHTSVLMFVTILAWTAIELVRYPYYMLGLTGISFYPITWLRYTLWIPLYPTGMISETMILWLAREAAGKNGILSYGVDAFFWFLTVWIGIALVVMPGQLRHMWKQRAHYLGGKKQEVMKDEKTKKDR